MNSKHDIRPSCYLNEVLRLLFDTQSEMNEVVKIPAGCQAMGRREGRQPIKIVMLTHSNPASHVYIIQV